MTTRARVLKRMAVSATIAGLPTIWAMPIAGADLLPNGYDVTCTPVGANGASCHVSGCPRVQGDEAGDVVHARFNDQPQHEIGKPCNDAINVGTGLVNQTVDTASGFTFSIQGCRKHDLSDDCGAWSIYTYTPPAAPKAPAQPAPVPAPEAKPDIQCPSGSPTPTVAAGQTCAPIPDVTNAIQASFGDPTLSTLDFNVTNTSDLTATCNYTAKANSLNPLVPKTTTRQFNVPANGNHTETFSGAPTFTTYSVVLSCRDASGKQKAELGHVSTSVTW